MPRSIGPRPLSEAISQLFAARGFARRRGRAQLSQVWLSVAGRSIAAGTRPVRIDRGVLHVAVAHSALLSELASFHKPALLESLSQGHPHLNVRDIRFRLQGELARQPCVDD